MAKTSLSSLVEAMWYRPSTLSIFFSFFLLPFSFLYCLISCIKRYIAKPIDYKIPIISIGNLTVGGSGKTPFTISLAKDYENAVILLRGYKRKSHGLKIVSLHGEIKCDVEVSGDEAMLYAVSLPNSTIIVSEDRIAGIEKAKELGAKIIFLDDGFSKVNILKYDILIGSKNKNLLCLPSGPYREPKSHERYANLIVHEDVDFTRETNIINPTKEMILLTGIANPKRLDKFLPSNIKTKIYYPDHAYFKEKELNEILEKYKATSLLVTQKDAIKMKGFKIPLSILDLEICINEDIKYKINTFLDSF